MAEGIQGEVKPQRPPKESKAHLDFPGKASQEIGGGRYAQEVIVWKTIRWSFIAAGLITLMVYIGGCFFKQPPAIDELMKIWSFFIPLMTLVLGYLFGKIRS